MSSCCPPNAYQHLAADYTAKGSCQSLPSGLEYYTTGTASESKRAVLIIPDVWGWNSGRVRNVADMLADAGYLTIVPKLMVPALEGGTDGDGLYPSFTFDNAEDAAKFGPYYSAMDYESFLAPKLVVATEHLKSQGAEKIGLIGFCWGGWVMAHMLSSATLADSFACGVICHPSVSLENMLFGRDIAALMAAVKKPLLLLPAKGDPTEYDEDGAWFQSLKANCPASKTVRFPDVDHGFTLRAPLHAPGVKVEVERAMGLSLDYLSAQLA